MRHLTFLAAGRSLALAWVCSALPWLLAGCPTGSGPEVNPDIDNPLSDDLPSAVASEGSVLNLPCTGEVTGIGLAPAGEGAMDVRGKVRIACSANTAYQYNVYQRVEGAENWNQVHSFRAMELIEDADLVDDIVQNCVSDAEDRPRVRQILQRVHSEISAQARITERAAEGLALIEVVAPAFDGDALCLSERLGTAFLDAAVAKTEADYLLTYALPQKLESDKGPIAEVVLARGQVRYMPLPDVPPPDPVKARVLDRAYSGRAAEPGGAPAGLPEGLDLGTATQNANGWWGPIELSFEPPAFRGEVPEDMRMEWFNPYLFWIERRAPNQEWKRISGRPLVAGQQPSEDEVAAALAEDAGYSFDRELTWLDADVMPGVRYSYRIIGLDLFGRASAPSAPVSATPILHPWPIQMVLDGSLHLPANPPAGEGEVTCAPADPKVRLYWGIPGSAIPELALLPAPRSEAELPGAPVRLTPNGLRITTAPPIYDARFPYRRVRITRARRVEVSEENGFPGERPDGGYPDAGTELGRPALYGPAVPVGQPMSRRFSTPLRAAEADPAEVPYFETSVPENATYRFVLEGELAAEGQVTWTALAEWVLAVPDVTPPCAPGPGALLPRFQGASGAAREELRRRYGELQSEAAWAERFAEVEAAAQRAHEEAMARFRAGQRPELEAEFQVTEYTGRISRPMGAFDRGGLDGDPDQGIPFGDFLGAQNQREKVGPTFVGAEGWTLFLAPPTAYGRMGALRPEPPAALPNPGDRLVCPAVGDCVSGQVTPLFFQEPGAGEATGLALPDPMADCPTNGGARPCRDIDWIRFTPRGGMPGGSLKVHFRAVREVDEEPVEPTEAQLVSRAVESAFEQEYAADLPWLLYDLGGVEVAWGANGEADLAAYTGCRVRRGERAAVESGQRYCGVGGDADACGICTDAEGCEGAPCRDLQMRRPALAPASWVERGLAKPGERVWLDDRAAPADDAPPPLLGEAGLPRGAALGRRIEPGDFVDELGAALVDTPTTFDPIGGGEKERLRWFVRAIDAAGNEGPPRVIPATGWFSPAPFLPPRAPALQQVEVMACAAVGDPCAAGTDVPRTDRTCVKVRWSALPATTLDASGAERPAELRVLLRRTLAATASEGSMPWQVLGDEGASEGGCAVEDLRLAFDTQDTQRLAQCYAQGLAPGTRTFCDAGDLPPGRSVLYQVQALAPAAHGRPPGVVSEAREASLPGAPCRDFERMQGSASLQRAGGRVALLPGPSGYATGGRVYGRPKWALLRASQPRESAPQGPWSVERQVELIPWEGTFGPQVLPPPERRHRYRLQIVEPTGRTCEVAGEWLVEPPAP